MGYSFLISIQLKDHSMSFMVT